MCSINHMRTYCGSALAGVLGLVGLLPALLLCASSSWARVPTLRETPRAADAGELETPQAAGAEDPDAATDYTLWPAAKPEAQAHWKL